MDIPKKKKELEEKFNQGKQQIEQLKEALQQIRGQYALLEEMEGEKEKDKDKPKKKK